MARLTLKEINAALRPYLTELNQKLSCEATLLSVEEMERWEQKTLSEIDILLAKEQAEVEKLQKPGLLRFWKTLQGEKEAALQEEITEWEAVLRERQTVIGRLSELQARKRFLLARLHNLSPIEEPIKDLLYQKEKILLRDSDHQEFQDLDSKIARLRQEGYMLRGLMTDSKLAMNALQLLKGLFASPPHRPSLSKKELQEVRAQLAMVREKIELLAQNLEKHLPKLNLQLPFNARYLRWFLEGALNSGDSLPELYKLSQLVHNCAVVYSSSDVAHRWSQAQLKECEEHRHELLLSL